MATQKRQNVALSSASSTSAAGRRLGIPPVQQTKKRAPLTNLTNRSGIPRVSGRKANQGLVGSTTSTGEKGLAATQAPVTGISRKSLPAPSVQKLTVVIPQDEALRPKQNVQLSVLDQNLGTRRMDTSPMRSRSDEGSVSLDESMSTCESMKSPDFEYIDTADLSSVASLERRTSEHLCISDETHAQTVNLVQSSSLSLAPDSKRAKVLCCDDDYKDPQLCAEYAFDIYDHLRVAETKKMPATDFMEKIQKDINASMRAILVDWLVEVAEEYRLVPDTLYLTVNYIDRYLSVNVMNRQRLQLLGVASMLIASKYEEICAPQVEEFCYITDNTYFREEVLQMESDVLKYLNFELTTPTTKCFLRRFVRAAQDGNEVPLLQLEFLSSYLAELSLLEYNLLCYIPSLIAASAIFLAKFMLSPSKMPWTPHLRHYTRYQPSELCNCVKALHSLRTNSQGSSLPAIREKYSQHKYKCVANIHCPATIPPEFFRDLRD
ncbi:cyclin-A1-4-like [Nymphaea colorata]|nr:cyclin-A1-4-like [Nymphaea colorata]